MLDALGSAGAAFVGDVDARDNRRAALPERVTLAATGRRPRDDSRAPSSRTACSASRRTPRACTAAATPSWSSSRAPAILWADLHGHSQLSDGTGTPEDYFRYARDVAGLDVVALTDHDHWGMQPLDAHPELWERIGASGAAFHDPGRFVTLLGYEWTSWIHGHRHVLYFDDQGRVFDSVDPALRERRASSGPPWRGEPALTFAHHSAGGPIATNWTIAPDPVLEPVTEIVSVHGSSEAPDTPGHDLRRRCRATSCATLWRAAIGSASSAPATATTATRAWPAWRRRARAWPPILAESVTREAVLEALRARRVYATNGPRILLRASLGGRPMGAVFDAPGAGAAETLAVRVAADAPLERVDIVRAGRVVEQVACDGLEDFRFSRQLERLRAGEYLYVRAVQKNAGAAWSSPFFAR